MSLIVAAFQGIGNGTNLAIASMTMDAILLRDIGVDDTTTMYLNSGNGARGICAYWDLGASLTFDQVRCTLSSDGDISNSAVLASSATGSGTWTTRKNIASSLGGTLQSFNQSFGPFTDRYVRLEVKGTTSDIFTNMTVRISDFRLYSGGNEYIILAPSLLLRRQREVA